MTANNEIIDSLEFSPKPKKGSPWRDPDTRKLNTLTGFVAGQGADWLTCKPLFDTIKH